MALIINADMPTCCKECDLRETVYGTHLWYRCFVDFHEVTQQVNAGTKSEDCPILGEIPDRHGRLIDAYSLAVKVAEAQDKLKGKEYDPFMLLGDVLRWIELEPTVLEASKETE